VAFRLTRTSTGWSEQGLYSFCSQSNCADGQEPHGGLIIDASGNLYGTTLRGGSGSCPFYFGCGVVFALKFEPDTLTVSESGNGSGTVTSSPSGIDCGSTCSASFATGTQVTLTAAAASGSSFTGWSGGGCSGTGSCVVTMNSAQSVSAAFSSGYALSVSVVGSPGGKVTSSPAGIDCGSTCSANFSTGTQVTLNAGAAPAWGFFGWGGACSGIANGCTVTINANTSASATFSTLFSVEAAPVETSDPALLPAVMSPIPHSP
jgi:hypothetical protein